MPTEQAVDEVARRALEAALALVDLPSSTVRPEDLTFRSWTPVSARKRRRRRFTTLSVAGRPTLVAKIPLDDDDRKVEREAAVLGELSVPPRFVHSQLVTPVGRGFVMTFVPSCDLPDALDRLEPVRFMERLHRVISVVVALQQQALPAPAPGDSRGAGSLYVDDPTLGEPTVAAALDRALVGPTHGDLAPWNVRYDEATGRVGIIDWEDFRVTGLPAIDVLNLLLTLGLVVFPEHTERGFDWLYDQLFEGEHWYARGLRESLGLYCSLSHQSPVDVIDLVPFFCTWLVTRIEAEGRDASGLYYGTFRERYLSSVPSWVKELRDG